MYATERMAISAGDGVKNKAGVAARPMNLFLEILRATAYLASTVRSVLYVYGWWKEYKQNG